MDNELFDDLVASLQEAIALKKGNLEATRVSADTESAQSELEPKRKNESIVFHTYDSGKKFDLSPEDIKKCLTDLDTALDAKILSE